MNAASQESGGVDEGVRESKEWVGKAVWGQWLHQAHCSLGQVGLFGVHLGNWLPGGRQ